MSEVYEVMSDHDLILNAISAVQSCHSEYCTIQDLCNCTQVIESLKVRFLNV